MDYMQKQKIAWGWLKEGFEYNSPFWHSAISWTLVVIASVFGLVITTIIVSWLPTNIQVFIAILTLCAMLGTLIAGLSKI